MATPVQLRLDPIGGRDGRLVLAVIELLRIGRDQVHAGTLTVGELLRTDAPIVRDTLTRYGLDAGQAPALIELFATVVAWAVGWLVPVSAAAGGDPDTVEAKLGGLARVDAADLLAHTCRHLNATLVDL